MKVPAIIEQPILNRMPWSKTENYDPVVLLLREWLVSKRVNKAPKLDEPDDDAGLVEPV